MSRMTTGGIEQLLDSKKAVKVGFCHIWLSLIDRHGAVPMVEKRLRRYNSVCIIDADFHYLVDSSDMCVIIEGEEPETFCGSDISYSDHHYSYLFPLVERVNCVLEEMNLYLCNVQISQNKSDVYGDAYKVKSKK